MVLQDTLVSTGRVHPVGHSWVYFWKKILPRGPWHLLPSVKWRPLWQLWHLWQQLETKRRTHKHLCLPSLFLVFFPWRHWLQYQSSTSWDCIKCQQEITFLEATWSSFAHSFFMAWSWWFVSILPEVMFFQEHVRHLRFFYSSLLSPNLQFPVDVVRVIRTHFILSLALPRSRWVQPSQRDRQVTYVLSICNPWNCAWLNDLYSLPSSVHGSSESSNSSPLPLCLGLARPMV